MKVSSSRTVRGVILAALGMVVALGASATVSASAAGGSGGVPVAAVRARLGAQRELPPPPKDGKCQGTPLVAAKFALTGVSRIAKLGSDTSVAGILIACAYITPGGLDQPLDVVAVTTLDPTVGAYFVIFRFVPATSTISYEQDGVARGTARLVDFNPNNVETDIVLNLFIQLSETRQDTIDLGAGDHCRTEVSAAFPFKGVIHPVIGSVSDLSTVYEIPRFSGCGAREDLDPLFTGLISGPGNDIRIRLVSQGPP
jgi:hypothetical protein